MPIIYSGQIRTLTQDQFHKIDHSVTGIAFEIHNALGRLHDEKIYQSAISHRVAKKGMSCEREAEIQVTHKSFKKSYYIDLIINGVPYETKAGISLSRKHEAQLLNYLLLTNVFHGKLINFRSNSVESKFLSTQLTACKRKNSHIEATDQKCEEVLNSLLEDWGTHLSINLYREALGQLLDSHEGTMCIMDQGVEVGNQSIDKLPSGEALVISGITQSPGINNYETHLRRLLRNSDLPAIQWINFNQSSAKQITLCK